MNIQELQKMEIEDLKFRNELNNGLIESLKKTIGSLENINERFKALNDKKDRLSDHLSEIIKHLMEKESIFNKVVFEKVGKEVYESILFDSRYFHLIEKTGEMLKFDVD